MTGEFRCYNRVSPFLSLFAYAALAFGFDRLLGSKALLGQVATAGGVLVFAALDQVPLYYFSFHRAIERELAEDAATFRAIEAGLPAHTMIFQLPFTPYPLDSGLPNLP